jgi:hypothetical protein
MTERCDPRHESGSARRAEAAATAGAATAGPAGVAVSSQDRDAELAVLLGPTRLAYFSPLNEQPVLADRKASFILGAAGLIVTVLLFFLQPIAGVLRGPHTTVAAVMIGLLAALSALLLVAARSAYAAYVLQLPTMPETLAFFRHVAVTPLPDYESRMFALGYAQALDAILHYNYSVATQAAAKFRLVRVALRCMRLAIPLWMLVLLLLAGWR